MSFSYFVINSIQSVFKFSQLSWIIFLKGLNQDSNKITLYNQLMCPLSLFFLLLLLLLLSFGKSFAETFVYLLSGLSHSLDCAYYIQSCHLGGCHPYDTFKLVVRSGGLVRCKFYIFLQETPFKQCSRLQLKGRQWLFVSCYRIQCHRHRWRQRQRQGPALGPGNKGALASLGAHMVKNLPAMQATWVQSLGQEDPLEEEIATHSSILAWRIPWTEEPGGLQSMGQQSQT